MLINTPCSYRDWEYALLVSVYDRSYVIINISIIWSPRLGVFIENIFYISRKSAGDKIQEESLDLNAVMDAVEYGAFYYSAFYDFFNAFPCYQTKDDNWSSRYNFWTCVNLKHVFTSRKCATMILFLICNFPLLQKQDFSFFVRKC